MENKKTTTEVWRNFQIKLFATEADRLDAYFADHPELKKTAILREAILSFLDKAGA